MKRPSIRIMVRVLNPLTGHQPLMRLEHAERLERHGRAHFTLLRQAVVLHLQAKPDPATFNRDGLPMCLKFDGIQDARPGMPVLPPSPEVLAKLSSSRGRVRYA
jgi:hypothetical protein